MTARVSIQLGVGGSEGAWMSMREGIEERGATISASDGVPRFGKAARGELKRERGGSIRSDVETTELSLPGRLQVSQDPERRPGGAWHAAVHDGQQIRSRLPLDQEQRMTEAQLDRRARE